ASPGMANLMLRFLGSAEQAIQNSDPHELPGRQLMAHVRDTISQVNAQLTLTVPTDAEAFDAAVGNLQGHESTPASDLEGTINVIAGLNSMLTSQTGQKSKESVAQNSRLLAL